MKKWIFLVLFSLLMGCGLVHNNNEIKPNDTDAVKIQKLNAQVTVLDSTVSQVKKEVKTVKVQRNTLALIVLGLFLGIVVIKRIINEKMQMFYNEAQLIRFK